jgi:hypothetical protein
VLKLLFQGESPGGAARPYSFRLSQSRKVEHWILLSFRLQTPIQAEGRRSRVIMQRPSLVAPTQECVRAIQECAQAMEIGRR